MAHALGRAGSGKDKQKHALALRMASDLVAAKFASMPPVRVSVRDKRPFPAVDGLCTPSIDSCIEDPCDSRLPMPIGGQIGYLDANALALIEQTGLPAFADVLGQQAAAMPSRRTGDVRLGATRRRAGGLGRLGGGGARVAAHQVRNGPSREGSFPKARPQLLVYGAEGRLEVIADVPPRRR